MSPYQHNSQSDECRRPSSLNGWIYDPSKRGPEQKYHRPSLSSPAAFRRKGGYNNSTFVQQTGHIVKTRATSVEMERSTSRFGRIPSVNGRNTWKKWTTSVPAGGRHGQGSPLWPAFTSCALESGGSRRSNVACPLQSSCAIPATVRRMRVLEVARISGNCRVAVVDLSKFFSRRGAGAASIIERNRGALVVWLLIAAGNEGWSRFVVVCSCQCFGVVVVGEGFVSRSSVVEDRSAVRELDFI